MNLDQIANVEKFRPVVSPPIMDIRPKAKGKPVTRLATMSALELSAMEFEEPKWIVPRYLPEGLTVLAGSPKVGKSWFTLDVALAVADGCECLGGIACDQGDVLLCALEDHASRLKKRITKLRELEDRVGAPWPKRLSIVTQMPRGKDGVESVRQWLNEAAAPRLVIIDVLAQFRPLTGGSGNQQTQYEADYTALKGLQELAAEKGVAIIVVHHTRKSGAEEDPFEAISGTMAISGAADASMILKNGSQGATLYVRGRDVEEVESAVVFDKSTCRWIVQGNADDVRRTSTKSAILDALEDADEPMSSRDVADEAELPEPTVRKTLIRMAKSGELAKIGRGRYAHPNNAAKFAKG